MQKRDYYEILEVSRTASDSEIKTSYRKMALKYHPDRNQGDNEAEERFKEAAEAYSVLSDTDKRARYDRFGHDGLRGASGGGASGFEGFSNIDDIFSAFGSSFGFGDIFGSQRGGRQQGSTFGHQRGSDLKVRLPLTLEEIASGVEKTISIRKMTHCHECEGKGAVSASDIIACAQCGGAGQIRQVSRSVFGQFVNITACPHCNGEGKQIRNACKNCDGEGRVQHDIKETIEVPPGVSDGNYISMQGKGNVGRHSGPAGDLIVLMEETPHKHFVRNNNDVIYELTINYPQAALGAEVEVPTLSGGSVIQIEPGTQPGTLLRMRNKGIPELNSRRKGDQIVRINIHVPSKLTEEEEGVLRQLASMPNVDPPKPKATKKKETKSSFFGRMKGVFS